MRSLFVWGLLCSCSVFGQHNDIIPVRYNQYFHSPVFFNPAASVPLDGFEVRMNSRLQTGPFNNINSGLFYGMLGLKKDEIGAAHQLGVMFQNENEGRFLNRTRFYGMYVQRTRLSPSLFMNTGIAMGAFSYAIRSSNVNAGGGATTADGKAGVFFSAKKWSSGVSINQIFNNAITPFSAPLRLRRFFSLYGHYQKSFVRQDISVFYYADITSEQINANLNVLFGIDEKVQIGTGYYLDQGMMLYGGLRQIDFLKKMFKMGISYFIPMQQRLSNTNVIELSLVMY